MSQDGRQRLLQAIAADDHGDAATLVYENVHHASEVDPASGRCALHEAAAQGRRAILGELLRYVLIHIGPDRGGDTPLLCALRHGHADCARLLLARARAVWPDERHALAGLIDGGLDDAELAQQLFVAGAELRPRQRPDLLGAARARELPALAAWVEQRQHDQQRMQAALAADDVATVAALLDAEQVRINNADREGWSPLARAVEAGALACLDRLAGDGIISEPRLPDGRSVTELAIALHRPELTRLWLARLNYRWQHHRSDSAARRQIESAVDDVAALQRALLGQPCYDHHRNDLLAAACWRGKSAQARWLLAQGGRLDSVAPAVLHGDPELFEALLHAGAEINRRCIGELPVLHLLVLGRGDSAALGRRLLQLGADLGERDRHYGTASEFARQQGRAEIAGLFEGLTELAAFRWQREARAAGIAYVRFYYDKAHGVSFNPNDPEHPLLVGGDYDGAWPMPAAAGIAELQRCGLWPRLDPAVQQLLRRLADGEDFALAEAIRLVSPAQIGRR